MILFNVLLSFEVFLFILERFKFFLFNVFFIEIGFEKDFCWIVDCFYECSMVLLKVLFFLLEFLLLLVLIVECFWLILYCDVSGIMEIVEKLGLGKEFFEKWGINLK